MERIANCDAREWWENPTPSIPLWYPKEKAKVPVTIIYDWVAFSIRAPSGG